MRSPFSWTVLAALLLTPFSAGHASGPLAGVPKTYCENHVGDTNVHEYGPPLLFHPTLPPEERTFDGSVGDCNGDGIPGDPDGHKEYSASETLFAAGPNALLCHGEAPHHPEFPTIHATDATGAPVGFLVYTLRTSLFFPCDGAAFEGIVSCVGSCHVPFPPGFDGLYHVSVDLPSPAGHVWTT